MPCVPQAVPVGNIESGSLLGVLYKDVPSSLVGYENVVRMFPLGMREFLVALGTQPEAFDLVEERFRRRGPVPTAVHPAVFAMLVTYDPTNSSALATTLLRLADRRVVSLDHLRDDYRLTLDRMRAREADDPIDAGLVSLLFDFVAQSVRTSTPHDPNARPTNRLLLSDVVDVARKNKRQYSNRLAAWDKTVEAATDSKGYSNGWPTWKTVFLALGCVDVAVAMLGEVVLARHSFDLIGS